MDERDMESEMRNSRTAAQSATVLTQTTHFISLSFRQYPCALHDIALPFTNTFLTPTCREPCGCSESILCTGMENHYTRPRDRPRPPAALPLLCPTRASINRSRSRHENIYRFSHLQQLPTPLRSGNEPHSWHGQIFDTFTFIHSSKTG